MPKITEMYAFVIADKDENDEGVMGIQNQDGSWMPLVGADLERINHLRPIADEISKHIGKPYKILYFKLEKEISNWNVN